jgi:hypothetical protein
MSYVVGPSQYNNQTQLFYESVYNTLDTKNRDVDKTKELVLSNIYSYKKNKAQNKLLFVIIVMCVILIIISYLNKKFMLLNDTMYAFTMGTIIGFTLIYVGYSLWDFSFRDNMNYDEYDYDKFGTINTKPSLNKVTDTDYTSTNDSSNCEISTLDDSEKTISAFFKTL